MVDGLRMASNKFIPIFTPYFKGNEKKYLNKCIDSEWISSQGNFVKEFEQSFSKRMGCKYGISTSSCTTALHLALIASGIKAGDEVICPALTFIAPANMISLTGAKPVLVDSERETWGVDPLLIERKITGKSRAILVVHPFGHSAKMGEILRIAKKYKLKVIEDTAEAPGAKYKNKILGSMGDIGCFSFFGNKIITTGEGGMIVTNNKKLKEKCETLRDHGMSQKKRYVHVDLGFNYRMTNMQAAVGLAQLQQLNNILKLRKQQKELYYSFLSTCKKITFRPEQPWCTAVHWLTTITFKNSRDRNGLMMYLKKKRIDVRPMIFPVHFAKHFSSEYSRDLFPISTDISLKSLHLPSSTGLSKKEIERTCAEIKSLLAKK